MNVPYKRKEVIGDCTLYLGDCLEILPTLERVDAVITDPPYGIGAGREKPHNGWADYGVADWDLDRPVKAAFDLIREKGDAQIVWGGNYFTDYLPPTMQWLFWDKGQRGFSLADCEFAWSSQRKAARIFNYARAQALQDGKEHPTQKPVQLIKWCIERLENPQSILDPFMGSGTTGVACADLGKKFTGIELHEPYFDIACERITNAYRQEKLF
jgi:DNA modification methylase